MWMRGYRAIQWILDHQGVGPSLHYLDDFILVGVEEKQAGWIKEELVAIFGKLGCLWSLQN